MGDALFEIYEIEMRSLLVDFPYNFFAMTEIGNDYYLQHLEEQHH